MKKPIVCFGEVLWDMLPSGAAAGGAPVNVAYHLVQHGESAVVITKTGKDEAGRKLKDYYAQRGMDTRFFYTDMHYPTGIVHAVPDEHNNMHYDIVQPVAWDFIEAGDAVGKLVSECHYFVYGSLAARSEVSRKSLLSLLPLAGTRVLDINLRAPHFQMDTLEVLMNYADILKLNEEELPLVTSFADIGSTIEEKILALSNRFDIPLVIVTLGAKGALLYNAGQFYPQAGYPVQLVDTVGSGDAFLAAFLTGLKSGESIPASLDKASRLGAFIAGKKGACPDYEPSQVYQPAS